MPEASPDVPPLRGLRPDASLTARAVPRRHVSLETNLCRKGIWHVGPLQLALPLDGTDTLGLLRVSGPPLSLFDLDSFAWLTERWRETDRDPTGRVDFTLYDFGVDLYGREPGGKERRLMRASLDRLMEAVFDLEGYRAADAAMGQLDSPTEAGKIRLLGGLRWSTRPGRDHHAAYLGGFIVEQLRAGYLTYLDWRVLRSLDGLAKRLWVYLESQTFKRSGIGEGAVRLWLGPPMLRALGMTDKHAAQGRRTLTRAATRITAVDHSFAGIDLVPPAKRGGTWSLVARRRLAARGLPSDSRNRGPGHHAHPPKETPRRPAVRGTVAPSLNVNVAGW